jgi:hypothetical protein
MVTPVTGSSLLRAADHLERGAGLLESAAEMHVPRWFKGGAIERMQARYAAGIAEARRGVAELESLGAPMQDAREAITKQLDWYDPAIGRQRVPDSLVHKETRDMPTGLRQHARALRVQAELEAAGDPSSTKAALTQELGELVSRPLGDLSREDALRIASISMLPAHLRPELPPTINPHTPLARLALEETWPPTYSAGHVRAELDNVRLHQLARELDADPAVTREALDAELRTIIALPDEAISAEQATRVSLMARLGDAKRPALLDAPRPRGFISLANMAPWDYRP